MDTIDTLVVGAGVVGLAAARALALAGHEVLVAEAADAIGTQASSRNSGVIHAGIYHAPGSLKSRLCVAGRERLYAYCHHRGVAHRRVGKLIVATTQAEVGLLERYRANAVANGVDDLAWLTSGQVLGLEPEVRCTRALWSPATGIVDVHELMLALRSDLEAGGGEVVVNTRVGAVRHFGGGYEVALVGAPTGAPAVRCRRLVNAAGLEAPALARGIAGLSPAAIPRAYFARGQYFVLQGRAPFRHLIYPVADTASLGIHVTLDLAGSVRFGPDLQWIESIDYRFDESRREQFANAIRRYWPGLEESRLAPGYAGIRPKISGPGESAADFVIQGPREHGLPGLVNLFGIESPGLTAALAIADEVVRRLDA
jgi:L-2-hydroxyglutarate oxidase LhgO